MPRSIFLALLLALVVGALGNRPNAFAQTAPAPTVSRQSAPSQTAPSQTAPSQTAPSQTAPSQSAPSQSAPSQSAPSQSAPSQSAPSRAPAAAAETLTPAQAKAALSVLQDDQKRAALVATLQTLAAPPGKEAATPQARIPLAPGSLGAVLLDTSERVANNLTRQLVMNARAVTDFPLLWRWFSHVAGDESLRGAVLSAAWRLAAVAAIGLAVERLVGFGLRRLRRLLQDRAPTGTTGPVVGTPSLADEEEGLANAEAGGIEPLSRPAHARLRRAMTLLRRLPFALGILLLDLLPIAAFLAAANGAAGTDLAGTVDARLAIVLAIGVYAVCRLVLVAGRVVLAPRVPQLRLVALSEPAAAILTSTLRQIVVIVGSGYAVAEILLIFGLYQPAHDAILRLTGLAMHLCLVILVIRCRVPVAAWLAGHVDRATGEMIEPGSTLTRRGGFSLLRRRVAEIWHWLAIAVILGLWLVYAFEIRNGVHALLHYIIATLLVLAGARLLAILLQGGLARALRVGSTTAARYPTLPNRTARYTPALRGLLNTLVLALTLVVLLQAWGIDVLPWFAAGALGGRILFTSLRLITGFVVAALLWEGANASLQAHLSHLSAEGLAVRAVRLRTLLPILRTTLLVTIAVVITLMTLSEIGIDIAPLLAGAGIVGVAIGFGSQKLVQDLITGVFLLLENAMQVGDYVSLAGLSGVVEHLSIRTIRLRASDGSIHIIPFSSVTAVTNTNRGQGNAPVTVQVAYEEDTDRICALLQDVAATLQADPDYKARITGPLQLWGVDQVSASSVTIAGQIPCTDSGRWPVQREFNRRVKQRFQAAGIQLALPTQELLLRHPLDVRTDQPKSTRTGAAA